MEKKVNCPNCKHELVLTSRVPIDTWLVCPNCNVDLVVTDLNPYVLEVALDGPEVAGLPYRLMWRGH
jgi:uncharacterized protein YbaR (Trm112 family)